MKYSKQAIPTRFEGALFRSRLEAKWASFFTNLEWKWEYEPADQPGWIPDFAIWPGGLDSIFVDVKPLLSKRAYDKRCEELLEITKEEVVCVGAAGILYAGDKEAIGVWLNSPQYWAKLLPAQLAYCPRDHITIWQGENGCWGSNLCGCKDDSDNKWFRDKNRPFTGQMTKEWRRSAETVAWTP